MGASVWQGAGTPLPANSYVVLDKVTAIAGQTVLNITLFSYTLGGNNVRIFQNGLLLELGADYTETSTTSFTLTSPAQAGDEFLFIGNNLVATSDAALRGDLAGYNGSTLVGGKKNLTGAIPFTLAQFHENRVVNVKTDFGAVGNGVTDDTAAIQAAIDAVYDGGLGTLFFPSGVYLITKSLMVWGSQSDTYTGKGISLVGQDSTNTIIRKTTNTGYGGASAYANDDAIFVLARRDLTAGNNVSLLSIHVKNFNLDGDFGTGKVAFGIYNRCGTGACTFDSLVVEAAIGFQTATDLFLSRITNTTFIVSTKGFSMLSSGTSNVLENVFVSGATTMAYELRGIYSSAQSVACDNCTGVCYNFTFAAWTVNGLGSESTNATKVVEIPDSSTSYVVINGPYIFPQNDAAKKVFAVGSGSTLIINGGAVADNTSPAARAGQLAAVNITATFKMNNLNILDTYAVASTGPVTRSAGSTKSGKVSVPNATPTALYTVANEEVGIFIAYGTGDNASIRSIAYVGVAGGNEGFAVLNSNALTLTNAGGIISVQHALGAPYNVGWHFLRFGDANPLSL